MDSFRETVQRLLFIESIPHRLILAHLIHFSGIDIEIITKLHDEYQHAGESTLKIIEEFDDNELYHENR